MFVFWSEGRLGNQMAQYAFCHSWARQRQARFVFVARHLELHRYFRLRSPWEILRLSGRSAWAVERILSRALPLVRVDAWSSPEAVLAHIHSLRSLSGAFQGERYLTGCGDEIHELFALPPVIDNQVAEALARRGWTDLSRVAVIHVRRGDYLSFGNESLGGADLALPATWYESACKRLSGLPIERAVVISDDQAWCKEQLRLPWPWECSGEDMITDLCLLRGAAACILSPSSFSWWGAWLNRRQERVVVAPRYWLGHKVGKEYPAEVIPHSWLQV